MAEDYVEVFVFEKTAVTTTWPKAQWVPIVWPYLTGLAQVVLRMMPAADTLNYNRMKYAIMDHYEILEEPHWALFGLCATRQGTGPGLSSWN